MTQNRPGPRSPTYCPRRRTMARSHWLATLGDCARIRPRTTPRPIPRPAPTGVWSWTANATPAPAVARNRNTETTFVRGGLAAARPILKATESLAIGGFLSFCGSTSPKVGDRLVGRHAEIGGVGQVSVGQGRQPSMTVVGRQRVGRPRPDECPDP